MTVLDLFWIFLVIAMLQPVLRQKLIEAARQKIVARIERDRDSRVILLVHRQETMRFLGFPIHRYIDINDSEAVIRAIGMTGPEVPLDIVLHVPAGVEVAAFRIARAIRHHRGPVTVFVPSCAFSGSTLIALAADECIMYDHAELGPVDPIVGGHRAAALVSALEANPGAGMEDGTAIRAGEARKALDYLRGFVADLLKDRLDTGNAETIASHFAAGQWTDASPLTYTAAKAIGLPVRNDMPEDIARLMALYRQPVRHVPTP